MADKKPRTLLEHAAYELSKAGLSKHEDPSARQVATNTMALVRRIEKMDMNEKQLRYTLQAFQVLCNHEVLTPLTNDPDEWDKFEIDRKNVDTQEVEKTVVWQSRRMPSVFSEDAGKTFIDHKTGQSGELRDQAEYDKQLEEEKAAADKRNAEASAPAKAPDQSQDEVPAAEQSANAPEGTTTRAAEDAAKAEETK